MTSESDVQNQLRVLYSQAGWRLWRNNRGVLRNPDTGRPVRFGLANDSPAEAKQYASADLIGIEPVLITPDMVGTIIGRFVSVECKAPDDHKIPQAQRNWQILVRSLGGYAVITDGRLEL